MKKLVLFLIFICSFFILVSCDNKSNEDVVKVIDIKLTDEAYAYAFKKGNVTLKNDFNSFLTEIKENGQFDEIVAKYFEGKGTKKGYKISTSTTINNDQNFIVATNCPFEPFEYVSIEDGVAYGIDIEIAGLYAESRGLNLYIKNIDFDSILTDVDAGFSDIGMAGMTITEDRLKSCDFSIPYYQASQKLVVSYNNHDFDNCKTVSDVENILKGLDGKKVGYQNGTTGNWYVVGDESWGFEGFGDAVIPTGYDTAQLAIQDVANGLIYAVVVDEAPAVNMAEAINSPGAKWDVFVKVISQEAFKNLIFTGLKNTILIAVLGLLIGIVIGTLIAIIKVAPKYKWYMRALDKLCTVYVAIFRGTPMVVQLLIAYFVIVPSLSVTNIDALTVAVIVFGLNSTAYVSEIMRGGLNSVDKGQLEAGRAVGLSYPVTMIKIIIPQAIKNILPTLGNEFITLIKETSVVSFITVVDLYTAFKTIGSNAYSVVIPYLIMALIYVLLVVVISLLIKLLERSLAKSDKRS